MKKITTYISIFLLGFLILNQEVLAQGKSNRAKMEDPYNKPAVWEKIRKDPKNKVLWEEYIGKKANKWNIEEKSFITRRRDELWADRAAIQKADEIRRKVAEREQAGTTSFSVKANKEEKSTAGLEGSSANKGGAGSPSSAKTKRFGSPSSSPTSSGMTAAEKIALDEAGKKQMDNAVALVMMESSELKELKKNITANFLIIQDTYVDIFKSLGLKYIYYEKIYPNGGYSEEKWVQEMDKKINDVKKKQAREITEKYNVAARGNM